MKVCETCDGTGMIGTFSLNDQPLTLCQRCRGKGWVDQNKNTEDDK